MSGILGNVVRRWTLRHERRSEDGAAERSRPGGRRRRRKQEQQSVVSAATESTVRTASNGLSSVAERHDDDDNDGESVLRSLVPYAPQGPMVRADRVYEMQIDPVYGEELWDEDDSDFTDDEDISDFTDDEDDSDFTDDCSCQLGRRCSCQLGRRCSCRRPVASDLESVVERALLAVKTARTANAPSTPDTKASSCDFPSDDDDDSTEQRQQRHESAAKRLAVVRRIDMDGSVRTIA